MAVLVSNGNTTLATASGFYRSDAYNAAPFGGDTHTSTNSYYGQVLSTARYIPLTFADTGKCMGVILSVNRVWNTSRNTASSCSRPIYVYLQEAQTPVTISIASPALVTYATHGLSDGNSLVLTTDGALPTGLVAGTPYYVHSSTVADPTNTYWLYDTEVNAIAGGSTGRINTSVTQSGTHTAWVTRALKILTSAEIWHNVTYRSGYKFLNFDFGAGYTIDTTAGKWQLRIVQSTGTGDYYLTCSDGTSSPDYPFYITYSDNAATASSVFLKGVTFDNTTETVNYTSAHGLSDGDRICLFTDATQNNYALPTGLTAGAWYYVRDVATYGPTGFRLSTTAGGALVSFSTDGGGTWYCARPDDMIVCKDKVTIDRDFAFKPYAGTGYTGRNACVILCDSPSTSTDPHDWTMLDWEATPAAGYDILISGGIVYENHSTWTVGTKLSPIPYAQLARIWCSYVAYTGTHTGYAGLLAPTLLGYYGAQGGGYAFYGEKPSVHTFAATLTAEAAVGATALTVADNTGWTAGDGFYITKSKVNGTPDSTIYRVDSVSGTDTINITTPIATYDRAVGAKLIKRNNTSLGIEIRSTQTNGNNFIYKDSGALTVMSGCLLYYTYCRTGYSASYSYCDGALIQPALFEYICGGIRGTPLNGYNICPPGGATIDNVHINWVLSTLTGMFYAPQKVNKGTKTGTQTWTSGSSTISNCTFFYGYWQYDFYALNGSPKLHDNAWHNIYNGIYLAGSNVEFYNNEFFGQFGDVATDYRYCGIYLSSIRSTARWENNSFDYCTQAIFLPLSGLATNARSVTDSFGQTGANTADVVVYEENYSQITFDTPTTTAGLIIDGDLTTTAPGFAINIQNDSMTNDDHSYRTYGTIQRCGDGLTDTTVHTTGSGKFSMRFESTISTDPLTFVSTRPTGNILGKDLVVGIWCKISSATYYAATHQLPRLTVDYDNGTESYAQAAESTAWQFLIVPITPATAFGQITVTLSTLTDATGADAYVYWDDASVLDPAGVIVNTGGLDLWSDGVPITPIISTTVSAQDVWAADPTTFGTGTIGETITTLTSDTLNEVVESEGSYTLKQAINILLSICAGKTTNNGLTFKTPNGNATRAVAVVNSGNERTSMTLTPG